MKFLLALSILFASPAFANNEMFAAKLSKQIETPEGFKNQHRRALGNLIKFASHALRDKGYAEESEGVLQEFGVVTSYLSIGDYEPISEFLDRLYIQLEEKLGEDFMRLSRLSDIKIFNFCPPVAWHPELYGIEDYSEHFVALAGSTSYWIAYGICVGASYGSGAVFFCSPVGWAVERIVEKKIAPKMATRIHARHNPQ